MGQKVNPVGMRVGINREWESRWYAGKKEYSTFLIEDVKIREYVENNEKETETALREVKKKSKNYLMLY